MNKVILIGRLTKDPELKATTNQVSFCNFSIAVDRRFKDANGQKQTDYINCVAWRQTATFISQYFRKGSKIAVVGSLTTRQYQDNQGQTRYVTEVTLEEADFVESKASQQTAQPTMAQQAPTRPTSEVVPPSEYPVEITEEVELPFEV